MKKLFVKIFAFFKKEHISKYVVQILLFSVALSLFFLFAAEDVGNNVLGTVIGFLFSTMILYIFKIIAAHFEDMLKVSCDTNYILKIYNGDPSYRKTLKKGSTEVSFAYADSLINRDYTFKVVDDKEKFLELDEFIMNNYELIFSAHTGSVKINSTTVRLDDFTLEGDACTVYLSRSTVFNHLVTNRAIDFALFEGLTLRDVCEYGPTINPYSKSKMSNHIGINALVFLSDGRLLIPRRNNVSTISKNQITSSIAVKLNFPAESDEITTDYLFYQNIIDNLGARVKLDTSTLDLDKIDVKFLGFGQNLYEGGKPQFYYAVFLNDIDTERYLHINTFDKAVSRLDMDKCIYVADYESFSFKKDRVSFDTYDEKGKTGRITLNYEMSYLCNLWHYEEYLKQKSGGAVTPIIP